MTAPTAAPKLELIPLAKLIESPWNTRKRFDPVQHNEMVESMKAHGQITSGTVRPIAGGKFEIAAGHRRFRAAKAAGLATFEAKVRELDDAQFVEILMIENEERQDVHPLEQADGFRLLMEKSNYDVARIAQRLQRSHDFVYDRLRLLQLTPELKKLFLENRFGIAQAIVLAKLSPDEQARATRRPAYGSAGRSGLWRDGEPTLDAKEFPFVAKTAKELEYWIAKELRFKEEKVELEELFPQTAVLLEAAEETGTRVVSISRDEHLRPEAKDQNERTFTRNFWKRADELDGSKSCEYAVIGVIRAGDGRGEALGVCLRRDKCMVHWKTQAIAHQKREAQKKASPAKSAPAAAKSPSAKPADKAHLAYEGKLRDRENRVDEMFEESAEAALEAAFKKAPDNAFSADGLIGKELVRGISAGTYDPFRAQKPPKSGSATAIVKWLVQVSIIDKNGDGDFGDDERERALTAFAIDPKALRAVAESAVPAVPVPDGVKAKPAAKAKAGKSKSGVPVIDDDGEFDDEG